MNKIIDFIKNNSAKITGVLLIVFGVAGVITKQLSLADGSGVIIVGLADLGISASQASKITAIVSDL